HERCLAILLNGGGWDQRHPLQRIHQKVRIHKLVRKERIILILELGSAFYGPGRSINLVVESQQFTARNLLLRSAIRDIHGERSSLSQPIRHWAQAVFRYRENYGDGLQLRNDCESHGSSRLHYVTRIHQPQADAAGDGSSDMAEVDLDLVILHRSLIVFYGALVLQNQLFLVIQDLLCDRVARPRGTIAFKIHLRLCEDALVPLQRTLRLQETCAVWA